MLLLAIMAVGTLAYVYQSRSYVTTLRNQRTALTLANGRLEDIRAAPYTSIDPLNFNYTTNYLDKKANVWHVTATDPLETVTVGSITQSIVTTVCYMDVDGPPASWDCVRIVVKVYYGAAGENTAVTLETIESP